jgi:hypothetical protein
VVQSLAQPDHLRDRLGQRAVEDLDPVVVRRPGGVGRTAPAHRHQVAQVAEHVVPAVRDDLPPLLGQLVTDYRAER